MSRSNVAVCVAAVILLAVQAGEAKASEVGTARNTPMVQDWSTNRAGFANPETPEEAKARGAASYKRWQRLAADPRFMHSLVGKLESQAATKGAPPKKGRKPPKGAPAPAEHRDWSNVLGGGPDGGGGRGRAGVFPAKFSFDINAEPSCANDFIVYPTASLGTTSTGTSSYWYGTVSANPTDGQTLNISQLSLRNVVLTARSAPTLPTDFQLAGTTDQVASAITAAVNRWSGQTGYRAAVAGSTVTITLNTAGAGGVVSSALTGLTLVNEVGTNSPGQPSILAFNQLYNTTCVGPGLRTNDYAPNVFWAYNTGGTVSTSPVISYYDNGKQVAFVQVVGTQLQLILLRWKQGEGTAAVPATPAEATTGADYRNLTGACSPGNSCMFRIALGSNAGTTSSPFVDYSNNVLYVGRAGTLHKVTGVFAGTPAEVTSGGFPASVGVGFQLSSPVYDFAGNVFVGSSFSAPGAGAGGALHRVDAATGAVTTSARLVHGSANNPGVGSLMLDVGTGRVYAFIFNDGTSTSQGPNCTAAPCRAVVEFPRNFTTGATGSKIVIGSTGSFAPNTGVQYGGRFDSAWFNSADSTGGLYVCGAQPTVGNPTLWKIPVAAGSLGTAVQGAQISDANFYACAPVSGVKNGDEEYLFVSVTGGGAAAGCTGSCLYMYNLQDLNTHEVWRYLMDANTTVAGSTFHLGAVTFTAAAGTQNCTATGGSFDISGNATLDADNLRACIQLAPGYTLSGTSPNITVTSNVRGNATDADVGEGAAPNDMAGLATGSHTDGGVTTAWGTTNMARAGFLTPPTSGIVVDNVSSLSGASQIYFSVNGPGGNAIQVSQAALQ